VYLGLFEKLSHHINELKESLHQIDAYSTFETQLVNPQEG
jgi:hypothetical protein